MLRPHSRTFGLPLLAAILGLILVTGDGALNAQDAPVLDATERNRARQMLQDIEQAVKDGYYDRTYRGIDLKAHFGAAREKIDTARSVGHAYAIIAQALVDFDDSHTFFIPPMRAATYEYGWTMQMVGDSCYVTAVKPGSDAEAKGLKPGDRVVQFDAFAPTRKDLWKARYLYQVLSPRNTLKVVVQSPGGQPRALALDAKVTPRKKVIEIGIENILEGSFRDDEEDPVERRHRYTRVEDIALWKMPSFDFDPAEAHRLADEILKGATSLILDLRGNSGGHVKTLEEVTRRFFDRDVKIADVKGRRTNKASVAKKRVAPFTGKVVVLVDAESASAAEVLARVMQLEKRATVIGDVSSGSVMQSRQVAGGAETVSGFIPYAVSVTDADVIMTDGKSLEHVGVLPDERLLPTAEDLAAGRDPVLARAATLLGTPIDPRQAGQMFPVEWKK
jgi:C-terminal processing protease CtpA/Prc